MDYSKNSIRRQDHFQRINYLTMPAKLEMVMNGASYRDMLRFNHMKAIACSTAAYLAGSKNER